MRTIISRIIFSIKNFDVLNHKKILSYLVFILISTVIWFLVTLSNSFETNIFYPVRFSNLPENKVLVNELPHHLDITVEAYGFTLLRYYFNSSIPPLTINLKKNSIHKVSGSKSKYYLLTKQTQLSIVAQLSDELKVVEIQPDSIIFDFSPIVSKKVPIHPNADYKLEKQLLLKESIHTIPDSIVITGPGSILDTIYFIDTKQIDFGLIKSSLNRNIGLVSKNNVEFSDKRVNLLIDVEKFTQGSFDLPIKVRNVPDSMIITTLPEKVNVTFIAALSDFYKINEEQFTLVADYNKLTGRLNDKLHVELKRYPSSIRSVKTNPSEVDFFLEKKNE